jgi:hypothetical protein
MRYRMSQEPLPAFDPAQYWVLLNRIQIYKDLKVPMITISPAEERAGGKSRGRVAAIG